MILINRTSHQKDITIVNINAPNMYTPNFIKQTVLDIKSQINANTVIVGAFNIPLSPIDRSFRPK
jgi:hypothetical protein